MFAVTKRYGSKVEELSQYETSMNSKRSIKRWIKSWIFDEKETMPAGNLIAKDEAPNRDKSFHFNVWFANGGKVIETTKYNKQTDRVESHLYVITHEANFGEEVNKIITMEGLR